MSISRVYQAQTFSLNTTIRLDDKASHHIARVLRAKINDKITVFNGEGGEYHGVITNIDKKGVDVVLSAFDAREAESPINIYLAQGIARGEKMDFIIQKAVELGVTKFFPLVTERCNVRLDSEREEKRLLHWQSVIISACEQSGRNRIPDIASPQSLKTWLAEAHDYQCFVLSPYTQKKLTAQSISQNKPILILIGPEGGLSDEEIALCEQHHFTPLNLGPRILRTETAGIAVVSALQGQYGDMA